jgi:trimeric autotransporter adhesin
VNYDAPDHKSVTLGSAAAGPVVLSNVAQGKKGTDAVNVDQLTALGGKVDSNGVALNTFVAYDTTAKGSVTLR